MDPEEMQRLEREAREDLAERAERHADQLPDDSEWKAPLAHLANRLAGSRQGHATEPASST